MGVTNDKTVTPIARPDELARRRWEAFASAFDQVDQAALEHGWRERVAMLARVELESLDGLVIPPRTFRDARHARETPAIARIAEWSEIDWAVTMPDAESRFLVLSGPTGVGKSTAAAWWSLYCIDRDDGDAFAWVTGVELARLAQCRDGDPLEELLDHRKAVIDDLGAESSTPARVALVDELVDRVHCGDGNLCELVITTNLKPKQFAHRYGARVVDRLADSGTWITLRGESLRRKAA